MEKTWAKYDMDARWACVHNKNYNSHTKKSVVGFPIECELLRRRQEAADDARQMLQQQVVAASAAAAAAQCATDNESPAASQHVVPAVIL